MQQPSADRAAEEVVRAEGVDAHVAARRDELRAGEVVEREVVVEEARDVDHVLGRGRLARGPDLAEELLEGFAADDVRVRLQAARF